MVYANLYRHIRSGNLYRFVAESRCVYSINKHFITYSQIYGSNDKYTNKVILPGTTWTRERKDFLSKFSPVI